MIEWVEELRAGFTEEFGTGPKIVTLATVEDDRWPRARSVVCREVTHEGILLVASDRRSKKNDEVRARPEAEICVWLPSQRRQFRIEGRVSILSAVEPVEWFGHGGTDELERVRGYRERVWSELSEAARALFFWPPSGGPVRHDPAQFPEAVRTGIPPNNFEVLCISASEVELLDLRPHPHHRRQWSKSPRRPEWLACDVSP